MSSTILKLTVTLCLVLPFASACFDNCRFTLCEESTVPLTPPNDTAVTSPICLPGTTVGIANSGEGMIETSVGMRNISEAIIPGLVQPFSPSFFKLYPIINTSFSGVGHEVPQTNQADQLSGTCVILPINTYQVLEQTAEGPIVTDNVALDGRPFLDCVSFVVA